MNLWPWTTIAALRKQLAEMRRGNADLTARVVELDALVERLQADALKQAQAKKPAPRNGGGLMG